MGSDVTFAHIFWGQAKRNRGGATWGFKILCLHASIFRQCHASFMWGFWWHLFYSKPIYPGLFPTLCQVLWFIKSLFSIKWLCTHADVWYAQTSSQKEIRNWSEVRGKGRAISRNAHCPPTLWYKRRCTRLPHWSVLLKGGSDLFYRLLK